MNFKYKRNEMCGSLDIKDLNKEVILNGWVAKQRDLGALIFIDLRDTSGISQVVIRKDDEELYNLASHIRSEYVLSVKGIVSERESKNPDMPTGDIEIIASDIEILAKSETPPIYVKEDDNASEEMRLKYRYLDLRKKSLQDKLKLRAKTAKVFRDFLYDNNFLEIETPFLTNPTPEGARDYLVPSRVNDHKFYALPQSPQQLKQISMIGGVDRYYQIVKCFRDEDLRANRQPEFTQVDIEMSFVDVDDVIEINEKLVKKVFKEVIDVDLQIPFPRMTYQDAMDYYGVDKPDLRFEMKLTNLNEIFKNSEFKVFSNTINEGGVVKGINIGELESQYSRKKIDKLTDFVKDFGASGLIWVRFSNGEVNSSISKFLTEDDISNLKSTFNIEHNALIFIVSGEESVVNPSLGNLRNKVAKDCDILDKDTFAITWVTDFPMFEYDSESDRYVAVHHPFTSPRDEDLPMLTEDPTKCLSKAYDLVINGEEAGGGSIRINDSEIQKQVFEALKLTDEEIETKFGFLVEALKYGAPPHGGIAYGLDRLVMQLSGTDNIKDVIAFPKTQSATCLLTGAPSEISDSQLNEIHIKLDK